MNLALLRANLRRKLDEESESFWSDTELDEAINDSYLDIWQTMLNAKHNGCLKSATLNIVANTATIALPSDFHSARLIERVIDNGTVPLWWDERFERSNYTAGVSSDDSYKPGIRFVGTDLVLEPTPADSVTGGIKLTYYFFTDRLSGSASPNGALHDFYHDLITYQSVLIAKAKEESISGGGADLGAWGAIMREKMDKFKASIETPSVTRQSIEPFDLGD